MHDVIDRVWRCDAGMGQTDGDTDVAQKSQQLIACIVDG
jgi:hypothetical protein